MRDAVTASFGVEGKIHTIEHKSKEECQHTYANIHERYSIRKTQLNNRSRITPLRIRFHLRTYHGFKELLYPLLAALNVEMNRWALVVFYVELPYGKVCTAGRRGAVCKLRMIEL